MKFESKTWLRSMTVFAVLATGHMAQAATMVEVATAADASILEAYPSANKGSKPYIALAAQPRSHFLLKFVVTGIGTSNVQSAKIRLIAAGNSNAGGEFRRALSSNWSESTVTWANAPAADGAIVATQGAITKGRPVDVDVTTVIRGDGTYSFRVTQSVAESNAYDYYSKENGTSTQPKLMLVLGSGTNTTNPTPTPTPVPTATPTPTPTPTPPPTTTSAAECMSRTTGSYVALSTNDIPESLSVSNEARINGDAINYYGNTLKPLRFEGGSNACMSGGDIIGSFPLSTSWDAMHDTYATDIRAPNFLLENVRIHNYGDCVSVWTTGKGFTIRGAYCSQIRDDMVSNDDGLTGAVEDSLFDGGYVFFSDRSWAAAPSDAVVTIKNNLVRLQKFENTYKADGVPGHGWFWKQDSADRAVKLRLHGNVFMAEANGIHSSHVLEASSILSCKKADGSPDNTIVWLGSGAYPRPDELKTGCFTLTTNRAVWDQAVANWKQRHGY